MSKHVGHAKNHAWPSRKAYLLAAVALVISILVLLLHNKNFAVFNAKGFVAGEQSSLIVTVSAILFAVAVPTLALLYYVAWKYRETNHKSTYAPHSNHGKFFAFSIWALPTFIMLILAVIMIPATQRLDPRKEISSTKKTLTVQVVAMRWKWIFIYPEQNIATVNYVQLPTDTPVAFELSADESPMSSFWIPNLGGQLYAMTGHVNTLHLMAHKNGDYPGSSAELTGAGFSGMKFVARATSSNDFDEWVNNVKASPNALDSAEYNKLLKPSENHKTAFYAETQPDLFSTMLSKYAGSHNSMEHMKMEHMQ